jgi:hypothetical protein
MSPRGVSRRVATVRQCPHRDATPCDDLVSRSRRRIRRAGGGCSHSSFTTLIAGANTLERTHGCQPDREPGRRCARAPRGGCGDAGRGAHRPAAARRRRRGSLRELRGTAGRRSALLHPLWRAARDEPVLPGGHDRAYPSDDDSGGGAAGPGARPTSVLRDDARGRHRHAPAGPGGGGRDRPDQQQHDGTKAPQAQVITVNGGSGSAGSAAATSPGGTQGHTGKAKHVKAAPVKKTEVVKAQAAAAAPKPTKQAVQKASHAASSVLGGNTGQSNNTVTSGQSCAAGSAGCSGGHFTGNFFGQ